MIYGGIEYHPVNDGPGLLAVLKQKAGEAAQLGEYARSFGFTRQHGQKVASCLRLSWCICPTATRRCW